MDLAGEDKLVLDIIGQHVCGRLVHTRPSSTITLQETLGN